MRAVFSASAPTAKGVRADDYNLSLSPRTEVISGAAPSTVTVKDRVLSRYTAATYDSTYNAVLSVPPGGAATVECLTPSVCSIDADGNVGWVSDGVCRLQLTSPRGAGFMRREVRGKVSRTVGASTDVLQPTAGATGSLRKHLWDQMLALTAAATPGAASQDVSIAITLGLTPSATTNPNLWVPGVDFSHSSFQKRFDYYGETILTPQGQCHLISPRHAIASQHVSAYSFTDIWFRRPDGSFQIVHSLGWQAFNGDSIVLYFDQDVTGVTPVKLIPSTYRDKLPDFWMNTNSSGPPNFTSSPTYPIPALANYHREGTGVSSYVLPSQSRHLRAALFSMVMGTPWMLFSRNFYQQRYPLPTAYSAINDWVADAQPGDSSSLLYLLINGELGAFGLQNGTLVGPVISERIPELTAAMNALAVANGEVSPSYAPSLIDLSGFNSY